jgi:putative CocE/NonD family hydrolase
VPGLEGQWHEVLNFFDHHLFDQDDEGYEEKILYYYTLGVEKWRKTAVWPTEGTQVQRWYLGENGQLSTDEPSGEDGEDIYKVDLQATTGTHNRWHTPDGMTPVTYKDRAKTDQRLLTYTSEPLLKDIELTGHPVITLSVTSTATDGAFFVYLEEVDPKGVVTYLTEGQLRAIHRKISSDSPPYRTFGPYHSYLKKDIFPLVPGEVAEISFALIPTSVQIKKDHQIRIAVAGHDKDTFASIPQGEIPTIKVQRNSNFTSYIDLPIIMSL